MSAKMKRCIDKLRGRQETPEMLQGEDPSGEGVMRKQESKGTFTGEEVVSKYDSKGTFTGEGVAIKYESKGTSTDDYDHFNERTMMVNREEAMMMKREEAMELLGMRRTLPLKQKIECEVTYWGPTKQIGEGQLVALLQRTAEVNKKLEYKLVDRLNGAFNVAYILRSSDGEKYCVRVPACGFPARWNEKDAKLLRATALGMKYIINNSKLPIPRVLAYSDKMDNEIHAPFTIMTFLQGHSVAFLWDDKSVDRSVQEARRQKIMHSLANLMCTLSTTTFPRAGTLWFPNDESHPVVGDSYRLHKDNIFAVNREFLTIPPTASVAELLRAARAKRFVEDKFPEEYHSTTRTGVYVLWSLMIEAFLRSAGKPRADEPEFVLMQSDFNPQNVLADETGNVTGIIDWDCLEAIPHQIGWCSLPHWLEVDWYPDYRWPPDTGIVNATKPDQYDRYREDYTRYIREARGGASDSIFTSRSHIYQALFDSVETYARVECFVYNVLADILPRAKSELPLLLNDIGGGGFRPGEEAWFEARLIPYFAPEGESTVKK